MSNQDLQMESWLTVNDVSLHQNIQTPLSFDLTSSLQDATPVQDTISGGLIIGNTQNEAIDANNNVKKMHCKPTVVLVMRSKNLLK